MARCIRLSWARLCLVSFLFACGGPVLDETAGDSLGLIRQYFTPPPRIDAVNNPYCTTAGGCEVEIVGQGFSASTNVYLGIKGSPEPAEFIPPDRLKFRAPAWSGASTVMLKVSHAGGLSTYAPGFTYYADSADFLPPYTARTSAQPQKAVSGDFNGDGITDLAVLELGRQWVEVLLGVANQRFATPVRIALSAVPFAIAAGKLNGDSYDDLVISLQGRDGKIVRLLGANVISSTMNQKERSLVDGTNICEYPQELLIADISNDGKQDVIVSCLNYPAKAGPAFDALIGNGYGDFSYWDLDTAPEIPMDIQVADWSGDGFPDLIFRGQSSGTIYLANQVLGSRFSAPVSLGFTGNALAIGDLNGDSRNDLVVLSKSRSLGLYLNYSTTLFYLSTTLALRDDYRKIAIQDMDGINGPDLVAFGNGATSSNTADVFPRDSTGYSSLRRQEIDLGWSTPSAAIADLNADRLGDLLFMGAPLPYVDRPENSVHVRYGRPNGITRQLRQKVRAQATVTAVADLDSDRVEDLAVLSPSGVAGATEIQLFRRDREDQFLPYATIATSRYLDTIAIAQLDNKNDADIVVGSSTTGELLVYYSTGSKTYSSMPESYSLGGMPSSIIIDSLNPKTDSYLDIAVTLWDKNQVAILYHKSTDGFEAPKKTPLTMGNSPIAIAAGCIAACTERPNLVVANSGYVSVLTDDTMGGYRVYNTYPAASSPRAMVFADVSGDGKPDVLVTDLATSAVHVLVQDGGGSLNPLVKSPVCAGPTGLFMTYLNDDPAPDLMVSCDAGTVFSAQAFYGVPGSRFAPSAWSIPKRLTAPTAPTYSAGSMTGGLFGSLPYLVLAAEREGEISLLVHHTR